MASSLDQDVIHIILYFLWNLHSTSWDSEFRPQHFRRFFISYSLISQDWTLPAQRYIYRSADLRWNSQFDSFEAGLNSAIRGQHLRTFVRVLDISISNSQLGIPLRKLDKVLRATPYLVELRLRIGAEINTLFARKVQAQRLCDAFAALRPTLRAFQLELTGNFTRTRVLKEFHTLVELGSLDFVTIAIAAEHNVWIPEKLFAETEWNTHVEEWTTMSWPIETNAQSLSMKRVLFAPPASTECLVEPEVLRLNGQYLTKELSSLFGSHLKEVLCQPPWQRDAWSYYFDDLLDLSPNLERLILLQIEDGSWSRKKKQAPVTRIHVVEREDWTADGAACVQDGEETLKPTEDTKYKLLERASHVVTFNQEPSQSWKERTTIVPTYRRPEAFDGRWLGHAMTGVEEERELQEVYGCYTWKWDNGQPQYRRYFLAIRKPAPVSTP
ncbi:SubName: Full=Uncharacterized protein {ECO:0000313/EMBL:CCA73093.1} [Serendipita indica DSM 11827]|uniref:Uncharacterized protein n=1 Tax=Serendipita indica (strain DSM 11827) TaxID=1109443 RepID=G4TP50_SERID|nr:SubName: Full=Uncharacterized protein {ECO:0000313/EMBL:CCA73093.1} [Serendipita indica DSM 11827]CCA73093.1 hypothetical protein PIIN_07047 [Serendipita indica DSM 11827]